MKFYCLKISCHGFHFYHRKLTEFAFHIFNKINRCWVFFRRFLVCRMNKHFRLYFFKHWFFFTLIPIMIIVNNISVYNQELSHLWKLIEGLKRRKRERGKKRACKVSCEGDPSTGSQSPFLKPRRQCSILSVWNYILCYKSFTCTHIIFIDFIFLPRQHLGHQRRIQNIVMGRGLGAKPQVRKGHTTL